MKKSLLFLIITFSISSLTFSQENIKETSNQNFNELKLNGLYLVIGAFDVTYERTLNEESGVGINIFIPFDDEISDDVNYYISPYYRFYFGKKYAAGFFVEGFGMLNSTNYNTYFYNNGFDPTIKEDTITDFALGIGLGGKWVTNSGFIGELNLGVGRNLFNTSDDYIDNEFVAKLGITIGYRF
ncbi:DUF3575 domain-containing protein [Thalassobellus citreus]|uniref:DUF3575 domain-containing protein n=1 Tax=Thalassobellus citreus TaxID=3367752 RepID=UPI0037AADAD5